MQLRAPTSAPAAQVSVGHWLEHRLRVDPARPLLVWYGPRDERVELSAVTFSNWVDKTINLLADLGWEDAPVVGAPLYCGRAGHWASLVWAAAVWQLGGEIRACQIVRLQAVDVAIIGPENPHPVPGVDTIACSLHPLGMGFDQLGKELIDYHEVLAQPDVHTPATVPDPEDPAWQDENGTLTHGDLAARVEPTAARVLVVAEDADAWTIVRRALLDPLSGGGSAVVVEGAADPARLQKIAAAEKAELA